jgi:hypothetical protein
MDKFRQFGSIISVTTDAILARCMSSPQPLGENRVVRSISLSDDDEYPPFLGGI